MFDDVRPADCTALAIRAPMDTRDPALRTGSTKYWQYLSAPSILSNTSKVTRFLVHDTRSSIASGRGGYAYPYTLLRRTRSVTHRLVRLKCASKFECSS